MEGGDHIIYFLLSYLMILSIITYVSFYLDKFNAKKGKWRIPEKTLLYLVFIGGSFGGFLGMLHFRHKTRKWKFKLGVPLAVILNVSLIVGFFLLLN